MKLASAARGMILPYVLVLLSWENWSESNTKHRRTP